MQGNGKAHPVICIVCCADRPVLHINKWHSAGDRCDFNFDDDDRRRFEAAHVGDFAAYGKAADIFRKRLHLDFVNNWVQ